MGSRNNGREEREIKNKIQYTHTYNNTKQKEGRKIVRPVQKASRRCKYKWHQWDW